MSRDDRSGTVVDDDPGGSAMAAHASVDPNVGSKGGPDAGPGNRPRVGARQYLLFEPASLPDYRAACYSLTPQTERVIATLKSWLTSREPMLALCGPVASGKTHLAHMMQAWLGKAQVCAGDRVSKPPLLPSAAVLADPSSGHTDEGALIIDEAEGFAAAPRVLLDLVQTCRERGQRLVLVGRGDPAEWAASQKDLYTRIEAMPRAVVPEPDEGLIRAVIMRHLRARQLAFSPADLDRIAERAARHIPCTFAAAELFTRALDMEALGTGEKPSQKIVGTVLDAYFPV
ncbi:MAG: hypothetical protein AAFR20_07260 [Pseudomonadota bacterium]